MGFFLRRILLRLSLHDYFVNSNKGRTRGTIRGIPNSFIGLIHQAYFVDLIMLCVSYVTYPCLMNGTKFVFLQPSRGLRQGDPLSPYLFICVVEAFIGLIHQAERGAPFVELKLPAKLQPSLPYVSQTTPYYFVGLQWARLMHCKGYWIVMRRFRGK